MKKVITIITFALLLQCVNAEQKKIEFSADKMSGSANQKTTSTVLTGNARVVADEIEITSDIIKMFGKEFGNIEASGSVKGENKKENLTFSADVLKYDRETKISTFIGNVKIKDTKNNAELSANYAYYDEVAEILILRFNVVIKQKETECSSIFAKYTRKTSMLDLIGKPNVKKDSDTFSAERILINLDTEDITLEGKVTGNVTDTTEKKKDEQETAKPDES